MVKKKPATVAKLKIEYVPIDSIRTLPKQPKGYGCRQLSFAN
jgi:hypothetical protein